ncbi:hypothetical protein ABZV45_42810, partial [Streptomyces sp. NPDC005077]
MARRNTRIRLARAQDTAVANALLGTAGVQIIRALRSAIEDGTAGSALLAGLGGTTKIFYTAAATDRPPMRPGATVPKQCPGVSLVPTSQYCAHPERFWMCWSPA